MLIFLHDNKTKLKKITRIFFQQHCCRVVFIVICKIGAGAIPAPQRYSEQLIFETFSSFFVLHNLNVTYSIAIQFLLIFFVSKSQVFRNLDFLQNGCWISYKTKCTSTVYFFYMIGMLFKGRHRQDENILYR